MELFKKYVDVVTLQKKDGTIKPLFIVWDDGRKFPIDKCELVGNRASSVGGCGIQFYCWIGGQQRKLYYEKGKRWFLESNMP